MKSSPQRLGLVVLAVLLLSSVSFAVDIPLSNWTVPEYRGSSTGGGITTMGDVTPAVSFVAVTPCRLVDTRVAAGFPAPYGPPSLAQGVSRDFDLNSDPQCTGIPAAVEAYSLNVTVTNTQGAGFIKIWPQGGTQPNVSTQNYLAGQTLANAAIVPAGTGGGVSVIAGVSGTDVIIDINGYFTGEYNPGVRLFAQISGVGGAVQGRNIATVSGAFGVEEAFQRRVRHPAPPGFAASTTERDRGVSASGDPMPVAAGASSAKRRRASASSGKSQRTSSTRQE